MFNALYRGRSFCALKTNFGRLQPECSTMKANCLQIFTLVPSHQLKCGIQEEKNLAKSLKEGRKEVGQESGKQETSSHLSWCQNELRQLSWGNTASLGTCTNYDAPRRIHVKKLSQEAYPLVLHSHLPPLGRILQPNLQAPFFALFSEWVVCKSSKWLSSLWLGSLLWKLYKKIPPRNNKSWWE